MPTPILRPALAALLALLLALQAHAQDTAPVDPAHVVAQLRRAYHKRPIVESVEVEARTPSDRRKETYTFRASAKGEIRLDLGDLILWTDGPRLLAVHRLNAGTYFEAELDPADRAASVRAALPPLPVPQLDLALQRPEAATADWNPGLPCADSVRWTEAAAITLAQKPGHVLRAADPDCRRSAVCLGQPPRLIAVQSSVTKDAVETTVRATITKLDEPVGRLEADLRGRDRVEHLTDLKAAAGDLRPGLAMPELIAEPLKRDGKPGTLLALGKPTLLIVAAGLDEKSEAAAKSLRAAATHAKADFRLIAAAPLIDTPARRALFDAARRIDDRAAWVSYSPQTTLRRLTTSAPAASAVIDHTGLITAVEPLDDAAARDRLRTALTNLNPGK